MERGRGERDRYRRYETRTIIKELSPEVIDGVRLIISFFTSPQSPRSGPEGPVSDRMHGG